MKILITSGGTSEPIDAVRAITNSATGRLGACVADTFAALEAVDGVHYLCAHDAARPAPSGKIHTHAFQTTADLEALLDQTLAEVRPDIIVHAAAVSDYCVAQVTDAHGCVLDRREKISSSEPELHVTLTPNPKLIGRIAAQMPEAILVGFKLLDGVTREALLAAGRGILESNGCAFVLANDKRDIVGDRHTAVLLGAGGEAHEYETKAQIAAGIAAHTIKEWRHRHG
ncbi:MAG: hypothetical protein LBN05_00405 [Oscillospiraceae bacterium]|jgi:phosphopantothenate-cysteine ligase|nr:hypothetical protein [Oscillospiraceae bacterium]